MSRHQIRKQKLIERRKRQQRYQERGALLPKDQIAGVVHEAVCEFSGDDGFGHCAHYAVAGAKLLSVLTRKLYLPQAGDLSVFDDGDFGMMMDANEGGVRTGEFHSWITGPFILGSGQPGGCKPMSGDTLIIDLSSRHFRKWAETRPVFADGRKIEWRLPDPPEYIWSEIRNTPPWFRVSANAEATNHLLDNLDGFSLVMSLVMEKWRHRIQRSGVLVETSKEMR